MENSIGFRAARRCPAVLATEILAETVLSEHRIPVDSRRCHSHSMVPGGFEVMSTVTRLISRTSLVIRVEIRSISS